MFNIESEFEGPATHPLPNPPIFGIILTFVSLIELAFSPQRKARDLFDKVKTNQNQIVIMITTFFCSGNDNELIIVKMK